jgi:hypothetical protein
MHVLDTMAAAPAASTPAPVSARDDRAILGSADSGRSRAYAGPFPTGEARAVNIGTKRKPCWALQGPVPSAADRQLSREVTLAALTGIRRARPLTMTERKERQRLIFP